MGFRKYLEKVFLDCSRVLGGTCSCSDSGSETISDVSDKYHMPRVMCSPSICSVVSLVFLFGNTNRCSGAPMGKWHILFFHDLYISLYLYLYNAHAHCLSACGDVPQLPVLTRHSWHIVNSESVHLSALSHHRLWKS